MSAAGGLFVIVCYVGHLVNRRTIKIPVSHTTELQTLKDIIANALMIPVIAFKLISRGKHVTASGETPLNKCLEFRDGYNLEALDSGQYSSATLAEDRAGHIQEAMIARDRAFDQVALARADLTTLESILRDVVDKVSMTRAELTRLESTLSAAERKVTQLERLYGGDIGT
jgi:hypothetical protein